MGAAYIRALRRAHPSMHVTYRDLAAHPVPHITQAWTEICDNVMGDGLYELDRLHEGARTPAQREAWEVLAPYLHEVLEADLIVVATPMYNFSIPSVLKAWLDQVTFPRMRLGHRRFVDLAARGGSYQPGSPRAGVEHQVTYLSDFIQGHFSVPTPDVTIDLGNRSSVLPIGYVEPVQIRFETSRLRLEPMTRQYADRLGALYSDPNIAEFLGGDQLTTEAAAQQARRFDSIWKERGPGQSAVPWRRARSSVASAFTPGTSGANSSSAG